MNRTLNMLALGLACGTVALPVAGQDAKRDPKVQAILDAMISAYRSAQNYQARVSFKFTVSNPELLQIPQLVSMEYRAQRPNKLNLSYVEKGPDGKNVRHQIVSDGASVFRWRADTNTYRKEKSGTAFPVLPLTLSLPCIDMMLRGKDPFQSMAIQFTVGQPAKVGGVDVDVLEGKVITNGVQATASARILVGQKDHLARAVIFEGQGKHTATGKDFTFRMEANYDQVGVPSGLGASDFTFAQPPGAKLEQTPARAGRG